MWMEEHIGDRINTVRTQEAVDTGANTIAVGCPFCMTMITDGTKALSKEDEIQVKDVAEMTIGRGLTERLSATENRPVSLDVIPAS